MQRRRSSTPGVARVVCASVGSQPAGERQGHDAAAARRASRCVTGVLRDEADALNRPFFKAIRTGLPCVTLKAAVTLDGKLATATGDSRWVTGEEARARVHRLRDQVDAMLVGANTVRQDDPQLTTRLPGGGGQGPGAGGGGLAAAPLARSDKVFTQRSAARTVVATLEDPRRPQGHARFARPGRGGLEGARAKSGPGGPQGAAQAARRRRASTTCWSRAGRSCYGTFLRERLADELRPVRRAQAGRQPGPVLGGRPGRQGDGAGARGEGPELRTGTARTCSSRRSSEPVLRPAASNPGAISAEE